MSGIMSVSKSSLGIRLALEDAASPESPFGIAMAMAHQVARQISGSEQVTKIYRKESNQIDWAT